MAHKFLTALDMTGNQVLNLVVQVLASDPTSLGDGHIYYNSTTNKFRGRQGGSWADLGSGSVAWADLTGRPAHLTGTENTANQVLVLDGSAKVPVANLPDIAISEYLGTVANEAAMLALTGQKGDWCSRTDEGVVYIITGADPSVIGGWTVLTYPATVTWSTLTGKPSTFTPTKFSQDIGDGSSTAITVTHNLGTLDVLVQVREKAGDQARVVCDVETPTVNTVKLTFSVAPASNALRVTIV